MFLGETSVRGVGVDSERRKIYFTNPIGDKVEVANLDDKARQTVCSGKVPTGLVLDLVDR